VEGGDSWPVQIEQNLGKFDAQLVLAAADDANDFTAPLAQLFYLVAVE